RLAVFMGGSTLEAAEVVCGEVPERPEETLSCLGVLVDQSLVQQEMLEGEPRYQLLMTLQAFGVERLHEQREDELIPPPHALYFLGLGERGAAGMATQKQRLWVDPLAREHDNLRAALRWTLDVGEILLGLRLGGALGRFWDIRSFLSEGRDWLDCLLAYVP